MAGQTFKREFSAGAVVYKKDNEKTLFLLGEHSGYQKWVLPKGLIERGETGWQTAERETEEETGVKCRIIEKTPIFKENYWFWAELKDGKYPGKEEIKDAKEDESTRRVARYQEEIKDDEKTTKTKILKTVTFYLAEYVSGGPEQHGWEMKDVGWFRYDEALGKMAFGGEKKALEKAFAKIKELEKQPKLL